MEPTIETPSARSDVLASFLISHCLLALPAVDDTSKLRRDKALSDKARLQRWLPMWSLNVDAAHTLVVAVVPFGTIRLDLNRRLRVC